MRSLLYIKWSGKTLLIKGPLNRLVEANHVAKWEKDIVCRLREEQVQRPDVGAA